MLPPYDLVNIDLNLPGELSGNELLRLVTLPGTRDVQFP